MRIESSDIRDLKLFKYYRLVRKWACKTNNLNDGDLELLIYLDCVEYFTRNDFIEGVHIYSWDKKRFERLLKNDWIKVWRSRNKLQKYNIYTTSTKCKLLITRMYKILLGEQDIPMSNLGSLNGRGSYTSKVYNYAVDKMIKDKNR